MSERSTDAEQPRPEVGLTFCGMSFAEFQTLTDVEVNTLVQDYVFDRIRREANSEALDEDLYEADSDNFLLFYFWRKHGIPDVDVSEQEIIEYVQDLIKAQKERNHAYGMVPEGYKALGRQERGNVFATMSYLNATRRVTEQPLLSHVEIQEKIEITPRSLWNLKEKDVLMIDPFTGKHVLKGAYLDYWLVNHPDLDEKVQ